MDGTVDLSISADNLGMDGLHDVVEPLEHAAGIFSHANLDETLDLSASFGALNDATLQRVVTPGLHASQTAASSPEEDEVEEVIEASPSPHKGTAIALDDLHQMKLDARAAVVGTADGGVGDGSRSGPGESGGDHGDNYGRGNKDGDREKKSSR